MSTEWMVCFIRFGGMMEHRGRGWRRKCEGVSLNQALRKFVEVDAPLRPLRQSHPPYLFAPFESFFSNPQRLQLRRNSSSNPFTNSSSPYGLPAYVHRLNNISSRVSPFLSISSRHPSRPPASRHTLQSSPLNRPASPVTCARALDHSRRGREGGLHPKNETGRKGTQ